jgi:hypothetical protein
MNCIESQSATMIKPFRRRPAATPPKERAEPPVPSAKTEIGEQIGRELRAMFNGVVTEPVPEKFRQLLDELAAKSGKDGD